MFEFNARQSLGREYGLRHLLNWQRKHPISVPKQLFTFGPNQELIDSLVKLGARFIIVGGLAVHYHAPERNVGDLDLLIERSADTTAKVIAVLSSCPFIRHSITTEQLLRSKRAQIPAKIYFNADILTPGEDIDFDQHWNRAHDARVGNTLLIPA